MLAPLKGERQYSQWERSSLPTLWHFNEVGRAIAGLVDRSYHARLMVMKSEAYLGPGSIEATSMRESETSGPPRLEHLAPTHVSDDFGKVADGGDGEEWLRQEREDGHFIGSRDKHKYESHDEGYGSAPAFPP